MSAFIHRFEPGAPDGRPLLLLHGTGGDENDLIPLGKAVAPSAPLLSPRGKVLEHGMPRFFRRLAEGVFDENDVRHRADELADFVENASKRYGLAAPIALGYSNGANVAAAAAAGAVRSDPAASDGAAFLSAAIRPRRQARVDHLGSAGSDRAREQLCAPCRTPPRRWRRGRSSCLAGRTRALE